MKERGRMLAMVEETSKKIGVGLRGGMQGGEGWAGNLGLWEEAEVMRPTALPNKGHR